MKSIREIYKIGKGHKEHQRLLSYAYYGSWLAYVIVNHVCKITEKKEELRMSYADFLH